jgi:IS30 family transposase
VAHRRARERRAHVHPPRRLVGPLAKRVDALLLCQWSPEQIAGRLGLEKIRLSHETIYQHVYRRWREGSPLYLNLRRRRKTRRARATSKRWRNSGKRVGHTPIEQRPKIVERRRRLGDYERDTLLGKKDCHMLLTIVCRTSRLTKIGRLTSYFADETDAVTRRLLKRLPVHTITNDNGKEFSAHKKTATALKAKVYFSRPYCSWQRGTNENTNGLLRQYFPKGTDFMQVSDATLEQIEDRLNDRPRKCLGYKTPREVQAKLKSEVLH